MFRLYKGIVMYQNDKILGENYKEPQNLVIVYNFLKVFYNCDTWRWPCKAETCCILILNNWKFEFKLTVYLLFLYKCTFIDT
jgi:hypothetical protein